MANTELTNMCMVYNKKTNQVLVIERVNTWKGISFPGGHVEDGESITEATIREIKEETGLTIQNLEPCGVIYWHNDENGDKYFVFNYRTETFEGQIIEKTEEGRVFWVDKEQLVNMDLSPGLRERLPMFFEKMYHEGFGIWNERRVKPMQFL